MVFTFNQQGTLQYVQLTFNNKNKFDELANQLATQYKMTKNKDHMSAIDMQNLKMAIVPLC